jgi:hypothetical protein
MSKGHGQLKRTLVEILNGADEMVDTFTLAALAFQCVPDSDGCLTVNDAQLSSVRRALGKLARERTIFSMGRHWPDGRQRWANERIGLPYTIKIAQHQNLADGLSHNLEAIRERLTWMLPLITRAKVLGLPDF